MKKIIACLTSLILLVGCSSNDPLEVHTTQELSTPSYFMTSEEDAKTYMQLFTVFSKNTLNEGQGYLEDLNVNYRIETFQRSYYDFDISMQIDNEGDLIEDYGTENDVVDLLNNKELNVYSVTLMASDILNDSQLDSVFKKLISNANNDNVKIYRSSQPTAFENELQPWEEQ